MACLTAIARAMKSAGMLSGLDQLRAGPDRAFENELADAGITLICLGSGVSRRR
jgi:hypothetical protein